MLKNMKNKGLINKFLLNLTSEELQLVLFFLTNNDTSKLDDKEIDALENQFIMIKKLLSQ